MHSLDKPTPEIHTDTADSLHDSPGRQLRIAREKADLTLSQVASELHLSTNTMTALEEDHYDGLPSEVFVIGYLRAYARLLGIDPVPLLEHYRRLQPSGANRSALPAAKRQDPGRKAFVMPLLAALVLLVIGATGWFWWANLGGSEFFANLSFKPTAEDRTTGSFTGTAPQPVLPRPPVDAQPLTALDLADTVPAADAAPEEEQEETQDAAQENVTALDESDATLESETSPPADEDEEALPSDQESAEADLIAGIRPEASPETEPEAEATRSDASENESSSGDDVTAEAEVAEVIMSFNGPCWVDVRDDTGEFKLFGEMNKGDRKVLGGRAPYSIILGNAAAVTLTISGKPFDVEAVARGNVARFDLDPTTL